MSITINATGGSIIASSDSKNINLYDKINQASKRSCFNVASKIRKRKYKWRNFQAQWILLILMQKLILVMHTKLSCIKRYAKKPSLQIYRLMQKSMLKKVAMIKSTLKKSIANLDIKNASIKMAS